MAIIPGMAHEAGENRSTRLFRGESACGPAGNEVNSSVMANTSGKALTRAPMHQGNMGSQLSVILHGRLTSSLCSRKIPDFFDCGISLNVFI